MNAAALLFRFRVFIFVLLYLLGFLPPWEFRNGSHGTLWLAASTWLARTGWIGLAGATLVVTLLSLSCLVVGAVLRVWGTAYLGSGVMRDSAMQGRAIRRRRALSLCAQSALPGVLATGALASLS